MNAEKVWLVCPIDQTLCVCSAPMFVFKIHNRRVFVINTCQVREWFPNNWYSEPSRWRCDDTSPNKAIVLGNSTVATTTMWRLPFPMLTRTSYTAWAMRMKFLLWANDAWGDLDSGKKPMIEAVDEIQVQLALSTSPNQSTMRRYCVFWRRRPPMMCQRHCAPCIWASSMSRRQGSRPCELILITSRWVMRNLLIILLVSWWC